MSVLINLVAATKSCNIFGFSPNSGWSKLNLWVVVIYNFSYLQMLARTKFNEIWERIRIRYNAVQPQPYWTSSQASGVAGVACRWHNIWSTIARTFPTSSACLWHSPNTVVHLLGNISVSLWILIWLKFAALNCWSCYSDQEHRNLPFMQELRNLFSLMVGSKRKYVDPSRAVEILKDAFKSSESQQVSLFLPQPAWCNNIHLVQAVFSEENYYCKQVKDYVLVTALVSPTDEILETANILPQIASIMFSGKHMTSHYIFDLVDAEMLRKVATTLKSSTCLLDPIPNPTSFFKNAFNLMLWGPNNY